MDVDTTIFDEGASPVLPDDHISRKPNLPVDAPGVLDLWEPTPVHELTDKHTICVLGVELKVQDCRPAERGGDFFILEATKDENLPHGGKAAGLLVVEVDRNRQVSARLTPQTALM
ncbi:hypothetical protein [Actinomadura coerulea]|uniref:hypothetical protein n=1 Tax=Actinomadura coerulea TaxID=46159 RepID=UPI003423CCF7